MIFLMIKFLEIVLVNVSMFCTTRGVSAGRAERGRKQRPAEGQQATTIARQGRALAMLWKNASVVLLGTALVVAILVNSGGSGRSIELLDEASRVPVRSTDPLGPELPSISHETAATGGYFSGGEGVFPLTISGDASVVGGSTTTITEEPETLPFLGAPATVDAVGTPTADHPVGVHVVDTPQGRVVYYPYAVEPTRGRVGTVDSTGSAVATAAATGVTGQVQQMADGSWEAPYGDYQAIQGSPAGAQGQLTQELSHEERQFEEYKKTEVRKLETVKSKVWRDHKRMSEMRREFDRLHEQVQELRFKWNNGPWPNTGKQGDAGPVGASGPTGPPGLPGLPGKKGPTVVLRERVEPTEAQVAKLIQGDVERDVKKIVKEDGFIQEQADAKLKATSKKMAEMKEHDSALIAKMKEQTRKMASQLKAAKKVTPAMKVQGYIQALEGVPAPLRPGWHEKVDKFGRIYYDNYTTHKTRWTRPVVRIINEGNIDIRKALLKHGPLKFVLSGGRSHEV